LAVPPPQKGIWKSMKLTTSPSSQPLTTLTELDHDWPQRIPFPPGGEGETGVYGPLTNGQRIARHLTPKVLSGVGAISGALLRDGLLPPAMRELIIVRVGYLTACAYEVYQHRSLARRLGVTEAKLDALASVDPVALDERERAVVAFVDDLVTKNRPSDGVVDGVRHHLTDGEVMEVIVVVGNWWMLGRMLETAGVPLDSGTIGERGVMGADGKPPHP
jgi:AhpD family alkylhydroperoxidase